MVLTFVGVRVYDDIINWVKYVFYPLIFSKNWS